MTPGAHYACVAARSRETSFQDQTCNLVQQLFLAPPRVTLRMFRTTAVSHQRSRSTTAAGYLYEYVVLLYCIPMGYGDNTHDRSCPAKPDSYTRVCGRISQGTPYLLFRLGLLWRCKGLGLGSRIRITPHKNKRSDFHHVCGAAALLLCCCGLQPLPAKFSSDQP